MFGSKVRRRAVLGAAIVVGVVGGLGGAVLASPAGASSTITHANEAAAAATTTLTIEVASPFPNPGDIQVQDDNGNVLATCQGSNSAGTATCTVTVNTEKGIILDAQPLTAGGFKDWTGESCSAVPGPVCHLKIRSNPRKAVGHFGPSGPVPAASPTVTFVEGDTSGCSGFNDAVTVNGTGFPATTAVTLSDNGNQVASGTTDNQGFAQLSYTANSEPGVYRTLVMGAGGATATTDLFNEGSFCLYQNGTGTGMDSFQVVGSDLDANSTGTVQFNHQATLAAHADASGAFTVNTPTYVCKVGTNYNFVIRDTRGAGTPYAYQGVTKFSFAC